jgi:hypothetical protein
MSIKKYFEQTSSIDTTFDSLAEAKRWAANEIRKIYEDTKIDIKVPAAVNEYYKKIPNGLSHLADQVPAADKLIECVYYNFFFVSHKTKATSFERMMARLLIKHTKEIRTAYRQRQKALQQLKAYVMNRTRVRGEFGPQSNFGGQHIVELSLTKVNSKLQRLIRISVAVKQLREEHGVNI